MTAEQTMALSTTRLTVVKTGAIHAGTGFYFGYRLGGDRTRVFCVTTRSLLADAQLCSLPLLVRERDGAHNYLKFDVTDIAACTAFHPSPETDLAAFPIDAIFTSIAQHGKRPAIKIVPRTSIPEPALYASLPAKAHVVTMICPNETVPRPMPVMARGTVISDPARPSGDRDEFLIDCPSQPGAGGAPVFLPPADGSDVGLLLGILTGGGSVDAGRQIVRRPLPSAYPPDPPQDAFPLGFCTKASLLAFLDDQVGEFSR